MQKTNDIVLPENLDRTALFQEAHDICLENPGLVSSIEAASIQDALRNWETAEMSDIYDYILYTIVRDLAERAGK